MNDAIKLMPGKFKKGDSVRLRHPSEHPVFDNSGGVLEVADVHWFRTCEPPAYVLCEPGGIGATPFRDEDLVPSAPHEGVLD